MEKNDDNLYEEMERFILYLQEGGADAAQSDELKMLKNPAYHNAFTRSGKIAGRILLIAGGAELLLLAFCFRQDQLLFFLLPLLIWPIFSLALKNIRYSRSVHDVLPESRRSGQTTS